MKYLIRPATIEDSEMKGLVHFKSWLETYPGLMPEQFLNSRTLSRCIDVARKNTENTLFAEVNQKVVGFICFIEKARDFVSVNDASEIISLYVLRDYQGFGIGKAFMNECFNILGKNNFALFVLKGNEKAIGFYQKLGFAFTGKEITQSVTVVF